MIKLIPDSGIAGEAAIREAAAGDYQQIMQLVAAAVRTTLSIAAGQPVWPCVSAIFADSVVIERDGRFWRYPYTLGADNQVTLGAAAEVVRSFTPVAGDAMREAFAACASFLEAEATPGRFAVRVIRAGMSGNANYYPDSVLREAVPLFDGARVFCKSDAEHLAGGGKDVRNLVGAIQGPRFVEGKGADAGEIRGTLALIEPDGAIGVKIREAVSRNLHHLFGLSVDAMGPMRKRTAGGRTFREALAFTKVASVDLIVEPGAGGAIVNFTEAQASSQGDPDVMLRTKLIETITAARPELLKGKDLATITDEQLEGIMREALAQPAQNAPAAGGGGAGAAAAGNGQAAAPAALTAAQLADQVNGAVAQQMRMVEARAYARETIAESTLPAVAKQKLRTRFAEMTSFREADVDKAITDERDYLAKVTPSGKVTGLGETFRVEAGESRQAKVERMLEAFFDPKHKDHRHAQSFKACYIEITGDQRVTGMRESCDEAWMREALGTADLANVLGAALRRAMVAEYRDMGQYDGWRALVNRVPAADFRTNERTRLGGYGDLPAVSAAAPYTALTSPTDEKATYAVSKRGGIETITIEAIKNDDVGVIRRIPIKIARAAKRTLAKFVFDFIRTNPTLYDSVAFFHATHGNLGAAALDATSLAAGRLAMLKQTELTSADRIGIGPAFLVVPLDLQETAVNLFNRSTNLDKTFVQANALQIIPVWYWTDTNDWALAADPNDIPGIEIGFLDGNEEPELFVADNPTSGSLFSNDTIQWKVRHIYGGNVVEFRGFYKAVV